MHGDGLRIGNSARGDTYGPARNGDQTGVGLLLVLTQGVLISMGL